MLPVIKSSNYFIDLQYDYIYSKIRDLSFDRIIPIKILVNREENSIQLGKFILFIAPSNFLILKLPLLNNHRETSKTISLAMKYKR